MHELSLTRQDLGLLGRLPFVVGNVTICLVTEPGQLTIALFADPGLEISATRLEIAGPQRFGSCDPTSTRRSSSFIGG